MQFPITDRAAHTFAADFYGAVADGHPVDQAVSLGRQSLLIEYRAEWATPVLFLRSPDGEIFSNISADEAKANPEERMVTDLPEIPRRQPQASPALAATDPARSKEEATKTPLTGIASTGEPLKSRHSLLLISLSVAALVVLIVAALYFLYPRQNATSGDQASRPQTSSSSPQSSSTGPQTSSSSPQSSSTGAQTFKIPSTRLWSSTNIVVHAGDNLTLTASGLVTGDPINKPNQKVNPDGGNPFSEDPVKSIRHAALMGKFGETGKPFFVGQELHIDTKTDPSRVGPLFLGINDSYVYDNIGEFTVTATITS
jgi:hypothetical protein